MVADWDTIENAEHVSDVYPKRFQQKELEVETKNGKFVFPLADGVLWQPGSDKQRNSSSRRRAQGDLEPDDTQQEEDEPESAKEDKEQAPAQPEETQSAEAPKDYWSFPGDTIHIHHVVPRSSLFVPTDENCPLPVKYLDVERRTYTDLENKAEAEVEDLWTDEGARNLSDTWRGKTVFTLLRPRGPPGYKWIAGRLTKSQKTSRPDHIWPEIWSAMGKKQQAGEKPNGKPFSPSLKQRAIKKAFGKFLLTTRTTSEFCPKFVLSFQSQ